MLPGEVRYADGSVLTFDDITNILLDDLNDGDEIQVGKFKLTYLHQ